MDKTYTAVSRISHKLNAYRDKPNIRELVLLSMAMYPHATKAGEFNKAFKSLKKNNDEFGYLQSNAEKVLKHFNNDDIEAVFSLIKSIFDEKVDKYYTFETLNAKYSKRRSLSGTFDIRFILSMLEDLSIENQSSISDISGEGVFMRAIAGMLRKKNNEKPLLIVNAKNDLAKFEILCNMAMNDYSDFQLTEKPEYKASLLLDILFIRLSRSNIKNKDMELYFNDLKKANEAIVVDSYRLLTSERTKYIRESLINNNMLKSVITGSFGCFKSTIIDLGILHTGYNKSGKIDMNYFEKLPYSIKKVPWQTNKKKIEERDYNLHYRNYFKIPLKKGESIFELLDKLNDNSEKVDKYLGKAYNGIKQLESI